MNAQRKGGKKRQINRGLENDQDCFTLIFLTLCICGWEQKSNMIFQNEKFHCNMLLMCYLCFCELLYLLLIVLKHVTCRTCEICGSTAHNVSGVNEAEVMEQWNESNDTAATTPAAAPVHPAETRNFWQGHRFLNFLLACMVFAFVISWLFHFNVPS